MEISDNAIYKVVYSLVGIHHSKKNIIFNLQKNQSIAIPSSKSNVTIPSQHIQTPQNTFIIIFPNFHKQTFQRPLIFY